MALFEYLPNDIMLKICKFLPLQDILNLYEGCSKNAPTEIIILINNNFSKYRVIEKYAKQHGFDKELLCSFCRNFLFEARKPKTTINSIHRYDQCMHCRINMCYDCIKLYVPHDNGYTPICSQCLHLIVHGTPYIYILQYLGIDPVCTGCAFLMPTAIQLMNFIFDSSLFNICDGKHYLGYDLLSRNLINLLKK